MRPAVEQPPGLERAEHLRRHRHVQPGVRGQPRLRHVVLAARQPQQAGEDRELHLGQVVRPQRPRDLPLPERRDLPEEEARTVVGVLLGEGPLAAAPAHAALAREISSSVCAASFPATPSATSFTHSTRSGPSTRTVVWISISSSRTTNT